MAICHRKLLGVVLWPPASALHSSRDIHQVVFWIAVGELPRGFSVLRALGCSALDSHGLSAHISNSSALAALLAISFPYLDLASTCAVWGAEGIILHEQKFTECPGWTWGWKGFRLVRNWVPEWFMGAVFLPAGSTWNTLDHCWVLFLFSTKCRRGESMESWLQLSLKFTNWRKYSDYGLADLWNAPERSGPRFVCRRAEGQRVSSCCAGTNKG